MTEEMVEEILLIALKLMAFEDSPDSVWEIFCSGHAR